MEDNLKQFPETLFVSEDDVYLIPGTHHRVKQLQCSKTVEERVPDNNQDKTVATYQLVKIEVYKKKVVTTETIEKVIPAIRTRCGPVQS